MPPRTRAAAPRAVKAAKPAEPEVSIVDQLAEDAAAVEMPTEYPAGAPAFKHMLAIRPFSKRAQFKRAYAEVAETKGELTKLQAQVAGLEQGTDEHYAAQLRVWAAMDDIFEKVNGALRLAAVDTEAYDTWSDALTDDNDLMNTFNVYQSRTQPGEA
jgi:hypothetical protein